MTKLPQHYYEFGEFTLDVTERRLLRAGQSVPLTPKVFDILCVLVEHRGHLLSKDELLRLVWQENFVEEGSLNRTVSTLRKALGEGPHDARYIETVPKRGYRFVAEMRERRETNGGLPDQGHDGARPPTGQAQAELAADAVAAVPAARQTTGKTARRRQVQAAVAVAALALISGAVGLFIYGRFRSASEAPPGQITLAVLPFHASAAPEEIRFLGLAIPDAVISRLSTVRRLRVRPTSAVLRFENRSPNAGEVGRELDSKYVVSGTVLKAGESIRVAVQLLRAGDGAVMWGEQYEVSRQELPELQNALAEQISAALRVRLTDLERAQIYRRYTENGAAWELYQQGRARLPRYSRDELLAAVTAFEGALKLDPNYAPAHAGLAAASAAMRHRYAREDEYGYWEERAKQAAEQALKLDDSLAEAHEALAAYYRFTEFNWAETLEAARRALELNPNLEWAHYYRARAFYHLGLLDEMEQEARAGLEVNPASRLESLILRGMAAFHGGRFAEAVALWDEAARLRSGDNHGPAEAYFYNTEPDKAISLLRQRRAGGPRQEQLRKAMLASFLAARGARAEAQSLLQEVVAAPETFHHASYSVGAAYAQLGNRAQARLWLVRAAETGFPCYPWYDLDPLLKPLSGDPEHQRFLAGLKKTWEAAKARYRP
jgi:DNA-binding winged helix-turn-helix (wHTH) protein/TolB-like protein